MQDASKVLMGQVKTSSRRTSQFDADPTTFKAGLAVRLDENGDLSLDKDDGRLIGVALGRSQSGLAKGVPVVRKGLKVPMLLEGGPARLVITITNHENLIASTDDTLQFEHDELTLDETLTFKASASTEDDVQAETSNDVTAGNLADAINAHSVLGTLFKAVAVGAVVTVTALDNDLDGADIDVTYSANTSVGLTLDDVTFTGGGGTPDYVVVGQPVYISDTTGKVDDPDSESTVSNATFASGVLTGVQEDGTEAWAVLVDMPGGL